MRKHAILHLGAPGPGGVMTILVAIITGGSQGIAPGWSPPTVVGAGRWWP
jgi:hypothetical protein